MAALPRATRLRQAKSSTGDGVPDREPERGRRRGGRHRMPVVTTLEFPGVSQELYERVGANLGVPGPPDGIVHHACGPVAGGWRITDIWNSQEEFDRFVDSVFIPAMRAQGGPEPSRREVFPTYHCGQVLRKRDDAAQAGRVTGI